MEKIRFLARAILAGVMISVGGTVFLMSPDKVSGAVFFCVGLFSVCVFGLALYTGQTGYFLDGNIGKNAINLAIIWIGNLVGCLTVGLMLRWSGTLAETAEANVAARLAKPLGYSFLTAIMCGVLMYIAVDNFRHGASEIGKFVGIMLCVPAFILAGFEHSIEDMFDIAAARGSGLFGGDTLAFLGVVSAGNLVGAVLFAKLRAIGNGTLFGDKK